MGFVWNFENLKAEVEEIDPQDPVAEFEIKAIIDSMDRSQEIGRITPGEAQCLLLMLCELQVKQKHGR